MNVIMPTDLQTGDRVPMSWDEYEAMPSHVAGEYIDGCLVVSPSASGRHQDISLALAIALRPVLPAGVRVREAWAWKPDAHEFIPDLIVFDETPEQARLTGRPHLVVEILSSDRAADTIRKFALYAQSGLEHYWIIHPDSPEIIEYRLDDGTFRETARHLPGSEARLDFGVAILTLDPALLTA